MVIVTNTRYTQQLHDFVCTKQRQSKFTAAAYFSVCSSVGVGVASFSSNGFGLVDFSGLKTKEKKAEKKNPIFTWLNVTKTNCEEAT